MNRLVAAALAIAALLIPTHQAAAQDPLGGALLGGAAGAIIGGAATGKTGGAVAGGIVGAAAGAAIASQGQARPGGYSIIKTDVTSGAPMEAGCQSLLVTAAHDLLPFT